MEERTASIWIVLLLMCPYPQPVKAECSGSGCTVTVAGVETPYCPEASCAGHCGNRTWVSKANCYCDAACRTLGDCCLDYEAQCVTQTDFWTSNLTENFLQRKQLKQTLQCKRFSVDTLSGVADSVGYNVVSKCDPSFDEVQFNKDQCEDYTFPSKTFDNSAMVIGKNSFLLFKNKYCAMCNNEAEDQIELATYDYKCEDTIELFRMYREGSVEQLLRYILATCTPHYDFHNIAIDHARLSCFGVLPTRMCFAGSALHREICNSYVGFVDVIDQPFDMFYTNYHCAVCSGQHDFDQLECSKKVLQKPAFFGFNAADVPTIKIAKTADKTSFLFDKRPICEVTEVLSILENTCMVQGCTTGEIQVNSSCQPIDVTSEDYVLNLYDQTFDVYVQFTSVKSSEMFKYIYPFNSFEVRSLNCSGDPSVHPRCLSSFQLSKMLTRSTNMEFGFWSRPVQWKWLLETLVSQANDVLEVSFHNFNMSQELQCSDGEAAEWSDNVALQTTARSLDDVQDVTDVVMIQDTHSDVMYTLDMVALRMIWRHDDDNDGGRGYDGKFWEEDALVAVCRTNKLLTCVRNIFYPDEYTYDVVSTHLTFFGKEFLAVQTDEIFITESGMLVVCTDTFLLASPIQNTEETNAESSAIMWVKVVGMLISVCALLFTLISFLLFPELQTVTGHVLMRLIAVLLVAQALFLTDHFYTVQAVVCKVVAAMEHLFWLLSFSWLSAFAVEVSMTFTCLYTGAKKWKDGRLHEYDACAWGIPIAIVISCLFIDQFTEVFDYGNVDTGSCWISPPSVLIYSMAPPLVVMLLINSVCFILCLVSVVQSNEETRAAIVQETKNDSKIMLFASMVMTLLIGITWLFGILAEIVNLQSLYYVFIVLNLAQGILLALWSAYNNKIITMYQNWAKSESRNSWRRNSLRRSKSTQMMPSNLIDVTSPGEQSSQQTPDILTTNPDIEAKTDMDK